jgi:hypothetical protein
MISLTHAERKPLPLKHPFAKIARFAKRLKIFDHGLPAQRNGRDVICMKDDVQIGCGTSATGYTFEPITLEHAKSEPGSNLAVILFGAPYNNGFGDYISRRL